MDCEAIVCAVDQARDDCASVRCQYRDLLGSPQTLRDYCNGVAGDGRSSDFSGRCPTNQCRSIASDCSDLGGNAGWIDFRNGNGAAERRKATLSNAVNRRYLECITRVGEGIECCCG